MAYTTIPASSNGGGGLGTLTATVVKSTAGVASASTAGTDYAQGNWLAARWADVTALAPTLTPVFFDECWDTSIQYDMPAATGTGLVQSLTTEDGGVFQIKSGVTASSLRIVRNRNATASPASTLVSNQKTHPWAVFYRVKIVTTPDAQTTMLLPSCNSTNTEIAIVVRGAISTTKLSFWINGTGATTKASAQSADIGGVYHDVGMVFDATTLSLVYDGAVVDTLTDLTNFDTTASSTRAYCGNGTTAANQEFHIDKWSFFAPAAV